MTRVAALALLAMTIAAPARPHELGKTQAVATLRDGRYQIDVVVDPDALLITLEAYSREVRLKPDATDTKNRWRPALAGPGVARAERDRHIAALAGVFLAHTHVVFDGQRVSPAFEYLSASAFNDLAQTPSVVRLRGQVPTGAREFSFSYGLALGTYALNLRIGEGAMRTLWIVGAASSEPASLAAPAPPPGRLEVGRQYFLLGFTHILPNGVDHVLFVVGIFLLTSRWRSIVAQVSTFTVAHSITLALTMYGVVSLPAKVVEPMIALSIAYVAIENVVVSEVKPWRLALVFSFGLLHGMGFAGVLRELGLPRPAFLTALVTFNAGVEAGQLTVIAIAAALCAYWQRDHLSYRRFVVQPASVLIALVGLFWTVQRAWPG
jgi:hydrogenase/urease accessory protein HupE